MFHFLLEFTEIRVALLAEGVDRNPMEIKSFTKSPRSPSSRRAWIEIMRYTDTKAACRVALLAEGVDRNSFVQWAMTCYSGSPSSRRAWIEIAAADEYLRRKFRRPPRGGRG